MVVRRRRRDERRPIIVNALRRAASATVSIIKTGGKSATLANDFGHVLINQLISRGVFNIVNIIAANVLTVMQFSAYNYFIITTAFLGSVVGAGLSVAATKVVAESTPHPRPDYPNLLSAIVWILAGSAALTLLASPILLPWLGASEAHVSPWLLLAGAFALVWFGTLQSGMQGAGAFKTVVPPVSLGSLLLLGGCAGSWMVGSEIPLIVGVLLFYIVPAALFFRHLRRTGLLPLRCALRPPPRAAVRQIAGIAIPSLGFLSIFTAVNWWIGRTLIEHQSSPSNFAEYAIGMQIFALALFAPLSVSQAIFPRYVRIAQHSRISLAAVCKPAGIAAGLVLVMALFAVPATPLLSLLYGGSYEFSHWFVFTIFLAAAFSAPVTIFGMSIIAAHGAIAWLKVNLVLLVLGLGLPLLWPPASELDAAIILLLLNVGLLGAAAVKMLLGERQARQTPG